MDYFKFSVAQILDPCNDDIRVFQLINLSEIIMTISLDFEFHV